MLRQSFAMMLAAGLLAGCGDPLRDVERIDAVALPEDAAEATALAEPEAADRPLLARLFGARGSAPRQADTPDPGDDTPAGMRAEARADTTSDISEAEEAPAAAQGSAPPARKRRGLLSLLMPDRSTPAPRGMAEAEKITPGAEEAVVAKASLAPKGSDRAGKEDGTGLFGGLFSQRKAARLTGPDAREIAPGTRLAFGQIARVCEIGRSEMGREVARSGGGKGKYRLHDSFPDSTAMRPFYITGFDDGCPRTVTAALAIFGSPSHYEALRVSGAKKGRDRGAADRAYDKARRKLCQARIGRDCGAQAGELERETAFLTVYDRFGTARNWRDILLHDGAVLAMDDS